MRRERFQPSRTPRGRRATARSLRALASALALASSLLALPLVARADPGGSSEPTVSGSWTARAGITGGRGNDRLSSRLSLEWGVAHWSGGFTLNLENSRQGVIWRPDRIGSLDAPERWIAWRHEGKRPAEVRLGTAYGLRFGQGLVLGAASFEGAQLVLDATPRVRAIVLAGHTDALDPEELDDTLPPLFGEEQDLGSNGRLAGARAEVHPTDTFSLGFNALGAALDQGPSTGLFSTDLQWSKGLADVSAEVAGRDGGSGAFVRTVLSKNETWGVTLELRRYDDFLSPVGNAPAYAGLSSGDTKNEHGALARYDFSPARWFSGSVSTDWSEQSGKTGVARERRIDNRLALRFLVSKSTTLAWGLEQEINESGRDGLVQTLLSTTAFKKGGRLAARLSLDRATDEPRDSLRLSYRLPLWNRRMTLLLDDTVQRASDGTENEFEAGASVKVGEASFVTVRGTLADGPDSVDCTWYQRF